MLALSLPWNLLSTTTLAGVAVAGSRSALSIAEIAEVVPSVPAADPDPAREATRKGGPSTEPTSQGPVPECGLPRWSSAKQCASPAGKPELRAGLPGSGT